MRYLIPLNSSQVNGKLQVTEGRIQLRLPNYSRIYPEAGGFEKAKDESIHVFAVEALPEQVNVIKDGGEDHHLLWVGSHQRRDKPGAIVAVPVESLVALK